MEEEFDPWEIDLVRFTEVYLERVRAEGGVDFAVAGRLLYMAWSILYLQSEALLEARANPPDPALDGADPIDDALPRPSSTTPEAVDVTSAVLDGPTAPPLVIDGPAPRDPAR